MFHSVRVAILDSGINPWHSHVEGVVEGGAWVRPLSGGGTEVLEGIHPDRMGHGTAAAAVIRWFAPKCKLYSIKVFDRTLSTTLPSLLRGLEWAIDAGIEVINLSLGTEARRPPLSLEVLCRRACEEGRIVVAAAEGRRCFPAVLPTVLGVSSDERCAETETFYVEGCAVEFRALGRPRPLPSLPTHRNLRGSSFAAARVTGLVASLLEENPSADLRHLRAALIARSIAVDDERQGFHLCQGETV